MLTPMNLHARSSRLAIVVALTVLASPTGCKDKSSSGLPAWAISIKDVSAPVYESAGGSEAALMRCASDGQGCAPAVSGATVQAGSLLRTAAGVTATVDLGQGTTLRLEERSEVALVAGTTNTVELRKGSAEFARIVAASPATGSDAGATATEPSIPVFSVQGVVATFDPAFSTAAMARYTAEGKADLNVTRGRVSLLLDANQQLQLRTGESAHLEKGRAPERRRRLGDLSRVASESRPDRQEQNVDPVPRGLGTMTARVPGTTEVISGVRLASHAVHSVIRDGFARTEVEEVFENETDRVLEGRYVFPLPPDASISRLALWVNGKPVEGEIVERKKAAQIFKGIVEDTVRPRDPALLEWVAGSDFSLKIFPIPAKGNRRVLLAYNQALPQEGGRVRYSYPLSLGKDRTSRIGAFSIDVTVSDTHAAVADVRTPGYVARVSPAEKKATVAFATTQFAPERDFVLSYQRGESTGADVSAYVPKWGEFTGDGLEQAAQRVGAPSGGSGYFALRLTAEFPSDAPPPRFTAKDRAIVIDTSYSQSKDTLAAEVRVAAGALRALDPDERFVVLACDSGCTSFPENGLSPATSSAIDQAGAWMGKLVASGSSDLAGALLRGAKRLEPNGNGQIVYVGDGAVSSGELSVERIAARLGPVLSQQKVDLRLVGAGRTVDEVVMQGLAQNLGATYERLTTGEALEDRIQAIAGGLRRPVVTAVALQLPEECTEVYPRVLPNLRLGEEFVVVGRMSAVPDGEAKILGKLDSQPYAVEKPLVWNENATSQNPLVPRLHALWRIAELQVASDADSAAEVIAVSKRFHVMSRLTSLLVLENDQMFAEFGIPRTARQDGAASDAQFAGGPAGPALAGSPSAPMSNELDQLDMAMIGALSGLGSATSGVLPSGDLPTGDGIGIYGQNAGVGSASGGALVPGAGAGGLGSIGATGGAVAGPSVAVAGPRANVSASASMSGALVANSQRVVAGMSAGFRRCFMKGMASNPEMSGTVRVVARIGPSGEVVAVTATPSGTISGEVANCMASRVQSAQFDPPEGGGTATVTIPVTMTSQPDTSRPPPRPTGPIIVDDLREIDRLSGDTATHLKASEAWRSEGEKELEKLRKAVADADRSRKAHTALVRGLLRWGRVEEALQAAVRLSEMDPDLPAGRELLSYAATLANDGPRAAAAVEAMAETTARAAKTHARAARAFEALGDEPRACAHWRSLAELTPGDDVAMHESLRCRARVFGDAKSVLEEARGIQKPGKLVTALIPKLESGNVPAFDSSLSAAGQMEAKIECEGDGDGCPLVVVIAPNGSVFSPWTPSDGRSGKSSVAFSGLTDGLYRTVLVGGSPGSKGKVTVRALDRTQTFPFEGTGKVQTLITTSVTLAQPTLSQWFW